MFLHVLFIYLIGIPNGRFVSHAADLACTSLNCTFDTDICCWDSPTGYEWNIYSDRTDSVYPTTGHEYHIYASFGGKTGVNELTSPQLNAGTYCLSVWYYISGSNLELGVWNSHYTEQYASKKPVNGDMWQQAHVEIKSVKDFMILIRAGFDNVNSAHNGVIAIDDVSVRNTPCPEVACTSLNCTFDKDVCCWTQKEGNEWTKYSDGVIKSYTGPKNAHTTRNGDYIYKVLGESNDKAELTSPSITGGTTYCLSVWYKINGTDVALKVMKADYTEDYFVTSNSYGKYWEHSLIEILPAGNIQIAIQGTIRAMDKSGKGLIAVDDVSLSESRCPLDCSFDYGWCAWQSIIPTDAFWDMRTDKNSNDHYLKIVNYKLEARTAKMRSTWQEPGRICLSIKFHIQGAADNKLTVIVERYRKDDEWIPTVSNKTSKEANVEIHSSENYKVILAGEVQSGKDENIHIENIASITGSCPKGADSPTNTTKNEADDEECNSSPCLNGAMCISSSTGKTYTCVCSEGWTGEHCTNIVSTTETPSTAEMENSKDSTKSNNKQDGLDEDSKSPILYIVGAGVAFLVIVVVAVVLILLRRRRKRRLDNMGNRQRHADNTNEMDEANEPMYEQPGAENPDDSHLQRSHNAEDENEYSEAQYSHTGETPETNADEDVYNHLNQAKSESNVDQTYSHIPNQKPKESVVDQTYSHIPNAKPKDSFVDQTYSHIPNAKPNESVVDQTYSHIPNANPKEQQKHADSNFDEENYDLLETSINDKTKNETMQAACGQEEEYEHIGNKNKN